MRIIRTGQTYSSGKLLDCKIFVRKNLLVAKASEWYYVYVGDYSYLPISDLLYPEDGEILRKEAEQFTATVELVTGITNRREGYRNVYLRMEESDQTENGNPLYLITMFDILDLESRTCRIEQLLSKYRHFLGLNNQYYFEYTPIDGQLVVYKYLSEKAVDIFRGRLEQFIMSYSAMELLGKEQAEQMHTFCAYLENSVPAFEMEFTETEIGERRTCRVKGGTLYKDKSMVAGIFIPDQLAFKEAYYLSPAARDAGTGLLNKKAATEYAIEKLQQNDKQIRWFVMMDIDDFKNVNDMYGHLFGDEVIRKVADVLRENIGYRGNIGRFGGDEYFVMLEKVPDREALKTLLKTIVKQLLYAFDPKLRLTVSIGISQYPKDGLSYDELIGKADKALYIAKDKGKNRHIIYDEALHGAYDKDNIRLNMGGYTIPREKRRDMLITLLNNLYVNDVEYVTEKEDVQKKIRELFDLDGITIYSDYGKKLVCRNGEYPCEAPDASEGLGDEKYVKMFGSEDILVESNMLKLKVLHPIAYEVAARQEIGASVQCITRKDGVPYSLINFDVFNCNRKWSDTDIEMLGIIGGFLGKMLCERDCK